MASVSIAQPACLVSPHLDDAVLSCGHWLAANPGVTVLTVFAGAPRFRRKDGWNYETTRKAAPRRAIKKRRREDASALAALAAETYWLDLFDYQYMQAGGPDASAVRAAILDALSQLRPATVLAPIGLHHPDHGAVGDACLEIARSAGIAWFYYLDLPYAQTYPDKVPIRLAQLAGKPGVEMVELPSVAPTTTAKAAAARRYKSQWAALRQTHPDFEQSMETPERFWRLEIATTPRGEVL